MEIEIARKAKSQCENEIRAILKTFELQTELSVISVNLLHGQDIGCPGQHVLVVEMRVEL
jgi:hypothetical protein